MGRLTTNLLCPMPTPALRRRYPLLVELGLLAALSLVIAAFAAPLDFADDVTVIADPREPIDAIEIPQTEHRRTLPPPPPPPAPVEVPDTEVPDAFEFTRLPDEIPTDPAASFTPPEPPPALESEPEEPPFFVIVEEPPVLIGGLEGLQRRVAYPELARRVGIEGTVFVQFIVDENGHVVDPVCLREPGGGTCEEALRAVRASEFTPGKQRGKAVNVRFSLPIRFRLR